MESCFVLVDGVRIHYRRAGVGPALLMVHGLIADGANWALNVPALTGLRTVYALDMMNMGLSERVAGVDAGLVSTADWLGRVMDALGLGEADLVGSSHGGAVCLMFAARHGSRVRSMVLFAPANPFCQKPEPLIRFWNSPAGWVVARLLPFVPRLILDEAHRRVYADPAKAQSCTMEGYRTGLNQASIAHLLRIVNMWWTDMRELQIRLGDAARVRALLIWGDRDGVVSVESGELLAQVLGARLLVFPGVGHLPFAEDAKAANEAMLDWLCG